MRMCGTLLAIMLGLAVQAVDAPQQPPLQNPSASHKVEKIPPPPKPALLQTATTGKNKIERVGKMSSRPWTKIVGWHPGTSQFPTAENHEPQLILVGLKF